MNIKIKIKQSIKEKFLMNNSILNNNLINNFEDKQIQQFNESNNDQKHFENKTNILYNVSTTQLQKPFRIHKLKRFYSVKTFIPEDNILIQPIQSNLNFKKIQMNSLLKTNNFNNLTFKMINFTIPHQTELSDQKIKTPKNNFFQNNLDTGLINEKVTMLPLHNLPPTNGNSNILVNNKTKTNNQNLIIKINKTNSLPIQKKIETTKLLNMLDAKLPKQNKIQQITTINPFNNQIINPPINSINQNNINAINIILARKQLRQFLVSDKNVNRIIGYRNKILHLQNQLNKLAKINDTEVNFGF